MLGFTVHGTEQSSTRARRAASAAAASIILFAVASARADEPAAPLPPPPPPSAATWHEGGPKTLDWYEGEQVPSGYHLDTQARKGLMIGGAVTFGSLYMLSVVSAAFGGARPLLIPVAGPFAALGGIHTSSGDVAVLIIDGVVQAGGIAMFVAGLAAPKTVLVRNDIARGFVMPTPMTFGASSGGLGLVGTF